MTTALLRGASGEALAEGWWRFAEPAEIVRADTHEEVVGVLERAEEAAADGLWAVGFVSYEAAPAFDPALVTRPAAPGVPAAWFGLFPPPRPAPEPSPLSGAEAAPLDLVPTVSPAEHRAAFEAVRAAIARGDTYQANLTYRFRGALRDRSPAELFADLCRAQPSPYSAYLEIARGAAVCSVSPELFFARRGERLLCRPMKGTAARGRTSAEDRRAAAALHASEKDRAENLMIVDMVRNDLGRIARPGSVAVRELFRIERYPSLFQMTSDVEAASSAPLVDLFAALFPCASVTGAPKVSTMALLAELETTPRGVYTGALGYVAPGGDARFSVAIRTAWCASDGAGGSPGKPSTRVEYGTGGGVVWDSTPGGELAESRTKVLVLTRAEPEFELLETLLWQPPGPAGGGEPRGYRLLARHLDRLVDSAAYFDFALDRDAARDCLERRAATFPARPHRVRLLAGRRGELRIEAAVFDPGAEPVPWRVALADRPVDESDRFLFHKTTRREVYERAFAHALEPAFAAGGGEELDDVVLWNQAGELTETTRANLVLRLDGALVTPPVDCGLLAGTARAELLARGEIRERRLTRGDLDRADEILLVNSLRGWIPARRVAPGGVGAARSAESLREVVG